MQKAIKNQQICLFLKFYSISVKRAAKALLKSREKLPASRIDELSARIAEFLKIDSNSFDEISDENLREIAEIDAMESNPNFECDHGERVVKYYENSPDGLHKFEQMWRQNFVENMKPKFLPADWSVDHNWDRFSLQQ